jgi:hypothetical protein
MNIGPFLLFLCILILISAQYPNLVNNNSQKIEKLHSGTTKNKEMIMSQSLQTVLSYPSQTHFLFWTGGYDSTFRLCQLLYESSDPILPIYISDPSMDGDNISRMNRKQEWQAMQNILRDIYVLRPDAVNRIYPILEIKQIPISPEVESKMRRLYENGWNHRPRTQYGAMAQVSLNLNREVEVGVENSDHSTMLRMVRNDIVWDEDKSMMRLHWEDLANPDLIIFKKFKYPVIQLTKEDMLYFARLYGFDGILMKTWSCWFPINGRPCGKCNMCRERII